MHMRLAGRREMPVRGVWSGRPERSCARDYWREAGMCLCAYWLEEGLHRQIREGREIIAPFVKEI